MAERTAIGIDLNGLQDAAAFDLDPKNVVGGAIPSVVLASLGKYERIDLTAGAEATRSLEGRGWGWPPEARADGTSKTIRVPTAHVIRNMKDREDFGIGGVPVSPANMMSSAIEALARAKTTDDGAPITLAIPDDGRFDEDAQQDLLNATRAKGLEVHLLWRSVAAVLGMADELNPLAAKLDGRKVAVISCLEEGVSVSRLEINISNKNSDSVYIVPKRRYPGKFYAFETRILELANAEAEKIAVTLGIEPWQVLWGDGMPLRWLLNLDDHDAVFQTPSGWVKHDGMPPQDLRRLEIADEFFTEIDHSLDDAELIIYEGPALEVPTAGLNLLYYMHDRLSEVFHERTGKKLQSLAFKGLGSHLAAIGCVEFGHRRTGGMMTYLDHLPQLRLAVRRDKQAVFKDLVPKTAECEGGTEFNEPVDLDFSIPANANAVEFYLLRDGALAPRHASEPMRTPPAEPIPIRMRIRQTPAQGRAQLSIEAQDTSQNFSTIAVNWDRMKILSKTSEADIIELLEQDDVGVPLVQPHPCHPFLWVYETGNMISLSKAVTLLAEELGPDRPLPIDDVKQARILLSRFQAPSKLTRGWGANRHPHSVRARPVSSNGELPEPVEGLHDGDLAAFDIILENLSARLSNENIEAKERNQIVTFCTWPFTRCPLSVREHLREAAERLHVNAPVNDFNAMGRAFSSEQELATFFVFLRYHAGRRGRLLNYHANGLFYILSLRENAPRCMDLEQANDFVKLALSALDEQISKRNYCALMRTCLRAIGGLIRYRLIDKTFLSPDEYLGQQVQKTIKKIMGRCEGDPARTGVGLLADDVLTVIEKRGVPDTILQWDGEEDENGNEGNEGAD